MYKINMSLRPGDACVANIYTLINMWTRYGAPRLYNYGETNQKLDIGNA
jgi:hypothetical protein